MTASTTTSQCGVAPCTKSWTLTCPLTGTDTALEAASGSCTTGTTDGSAVNLTGQKGNVTCSDSAPRARAGAAPGAGGVRVYVFVCVGGG